MTKSKYLIILIIIVLWNNAGFCFTNIDNSQIKYGTLYKSEIWNNNVYIIGDVIIPEDVTVTVEAGTIITFADYDIFKGGKDKSQCEIIVYGVFDLKSREQNPIKVVSINDDHLRNLSIDENTQIVKFYPYKVETENLKKEFRSFKTKYLIFWSLIYMLRTL